MTHERTGKTVGMLMVAIALLVASSAATAKSLLDDWYTIDLAGARVGSMHSTAVEEDGQIKSKTELKMSLKRAAMEVDIAFTLSWIETDRGVPIEAKILQRMSQMETISTWRFNADEISITSVSAGSPVVTTAPLPKEAWLTPYFSQRFFVERAKAGDDTIEVKTMSPEVGPTMLTVTYTRVGEDDIDLGGKTIQTTKWKMVNSATPSIKSWTWLSSDGVMVKSETDLGMGIMVMTLSDRKTVEAGSSDELPEVFLKLLIEPNRKIDNFLKVKRAVLKVRTNDNSTLELPSVGNQSIAGVQDGVIIVVVDVDVAQPATAEELADPKFMERTVMIDASDSEIQKLHRQAMKEVAPDASTLERADALRQFVFDYIDEKNFGTAFATASEVARTRTGDCSEHGVLLAAMLRADQIPSRVAFGLVYVPFGKPNGSFGWHMWSQGLIDGNWVDLDPTLPVTHTGGHITTGTSAMDQSMGGAELAGIVSLLGNIQIDVVDVTY